MISPSNRRRGGEAVTGDDFDAVIVGAGLAGVYALHSLRRQGLRVLVLEASDEVGGTWYNNRYPGARCDIESLDYSYSFSEELQQDWTWTERYASQSEILAYILHVVERFGLRKDIQLQTRVISAEFHESDHLWSVHTDAGDVYRATYCLLATGVLSAAQLPDIAGINTFAGRSYHTSDWPSEGVDFTGDRVGVIGTGSSATQLIPIVAEQAEHLTVFQRTPNFVMPAQNRPLDEDELQEWKANYPQLREHARQTKNGHNQISNPVRGRDVTSEERRAEFERRWQLGGLYMMRAFTDILTDEDVNAEAGDFVRDKIREIVDDPQTAEDLLPPAEMALGTKRLPSGTGYYETFNRDNVSLVNLRKDPIRTITERGIRTNTQEYELDAIVYATGFDAMTGSYTRIDVRGRQGVSLRDKWRHGPRTYLGVMTPGFPNLFVLAGPQTPSVFSNMVTLIEIHVEWVTECIRFLEERGFSIEAAESAEEAWSEHVTELANQTLYAKSRNSWFWGANTPGKARVFTPYIGGIDRYLKTLHEVAEDDYDGFILETRRAASLRH